MTDEQRRQAWREALRQADAVRLADVDPVLHETLTALYAILHAVSAVSLKQPMTEAGPDDIVRGFLGLAQEAIQKASAFARERAAGENVP
jgi:hypothetical protein